MTYNDKQTVRYTVKSITPNYRCANGYQPKNGEVVVFDIDVETYPELINDPAKSFSFNSDWKAIAENGTTMNGNPLTYGCLDSSEALLQRFGPGEKATGKVAFDVPAPSGILVFTPAGPDAGGWEWNYPAK